MDSGFFIGLALAIPLAVVANLITPASSRLMGRTSSRGKAWLERQRAEEQAAVEKAVIRPELFTHWLMMNLFAGVATLFLALVGIGGLALLTVIGGDEHYVGPLISAQIILTFSTAMLFQRFNKAARLRRAVRDRLEGLSPDE